MVYCPAFLDLSLYLYSFRLAQPKVFGDEEGDVSDHSAAAGLKEEPALPRIVYRSGVEAQANANHDIDCAAS